MPADLSWQAKVVRVHYIPLRIKLIFCATENEHIHFTAVSPLYGFIMAFDTLTFAPRRISLYSAQTPYESVTVSPRYRNPRTFPKSYAGVRFMVHMATALSTVGLCEALGQTSP